LTTVGQSLRRWVLRCWQTLKKYSKPPSPSSFTPASGTGAWEAALVNTLNAGDHVLIYETGRFAALWQKLAVRLGLKTEVMSYPGAFN